MKVGRRRLVERSAPGPGRSPKADPRLGVVLYDGVEPIDVVGTICVVSMAARVLPAIVNWAIKVCEPDQANCSAPPLTTCSSSKGQNHGSSGKTGAKAIASRQRTR